MISFIVNRVKVLFYMIVAVFRKALCCFRRRRPSCEPLPLTNVGIVVNSDKRNDMQIAWHSWDETPTVVTEHSHRNSIQEQIDLYRQQRQHSQSEDESEMVNFFENMTPRITRQKKYLLHDKTNQPNWAANPSSLSFAADPNYHQTSELGVWEEGQGWEDQTQQDWEGDSILKEKKRLDRERKLVEQQRRKMERDYQSKKQMIGVRMS